MRKQRIIALLAAFSVAVSAFGTISVGAAADEEFPYTALTEPLDTAQEDENTVTIAGCTIPADATSICLIGGSEYDAMADVYKTIYCPDYGDAYYFHPEFYAVDCTEIAEKLPDLQSLSILKSDVTNLKALSGMKSLKTLELQLCSGTTDISFLKGMTKLTTLKYIDKNCTDISPVKSLKKLDTLVLSPSDTLSDLSVVSGLKKLTYLDIDFQFKSLKPLAKLTKLKTLKVSSNALSDISTLSKLKNLTTLEIQERNNIKDITVIGKLTKLNTLMLHSMKVNSLAPLKKLKKLESLTVMYVDCPDARSVISGLTALKELGLADVDVGKDCKFMKKLKQLETISILYVGLNSIDGMQNCKKLGNLLLQENGTITDLTPLKKLTKLETLSMGNNGISDISPLAKLKNVKSLSIQGNRITDYSVLLGMKKLEFLWTDGLPSDIRQAVLKANPECVIY